MLPFFCSRRLFLEQTVQLVELCLANPFMIFCISELTWFFF